MRREHSTGPGSCKSQIYLKTEALHFFFKKKNPLGHLLVATTNLFNLIEPNLIDLIEPNTACVYSLEFYKEP